MKFAGWVGASAVVVLAFAAPAAAQLVPSNNGALPAPGIELGGNKQVDPATAEKRKDIERAYRDATQKIPAQAAATNDPWANMRGPNETKPAAKSAQNKPQPKKKIPAQ